MVLRLPNTYDKVGRPRLYTDIQEWRERIDDYFKDPVNKRTVIPKDGEPYQIPILTKSGLAYHLGFVSNASVRDYINRKEEDEFTIALKKAIFFIESDYEARLSEGNVTGAIFALKNMGWKDKTEVEQSHNFKEMPKVTLSSGEELKPDIGD